MKVRIDKTFRRDVRKINAQGLNQKIHLVILEAIDADNFQQIRNLKKLKGGSNHFRIKVGNYRLGLIIDGNTIDFIRCLHRKDIYKYFPK